MSAEAPAPETGAAGTTTGPIPQKVTDTKMLQDLLAMQAGKKLYDRALVRLTSKNEAMERVQISPFDLQSENFKAHIVSCNSGGKQTLYRWERKNDQVFLHQYTLSPGKPGNLSENVFVEVKQTYDSKDHAVWSYNGQKPADFPDSLDKLPLLDERLDQLRLEEQRRTHGTLASVVDSTRSIGKGTFKEFQEYCKTLNSWVTDQLITESSFPQSFQATYINGGKFYLGKIEWNRQTKQFEVKSDLELKKGEGNTFLVGDASVTNSDDFVREVQGQSESLREFQSKVSVIKRTQEALVELAESADSGKTHVLNPILTALPVSELGRPYYCFDLQSTGQQRIKSGVLRDSVYQLANPTVSLLTTEGDRSVVLTYPLTITSQGKVKLSQELKAKLTIDEDKEYTVTELQALLNERCVGTVTKLVRDIREKEKALFQSYKDRNISDAREALPQYLSRNKSEDRQRTWYCIAKNEGALASGSAYAVYFHRSSGAEATFQTPIPIVCLPDGRLSYKGDIFRDLQALHGKIRGASGTDAWEINSEMFDDRGVGDKWQSWDQLHLRQR